MTKRVDEIIEAEPFGRFQMLILALISLAIIVDGFDIQAIAFVGPVLTAEWGITKAELAPAISGALIGMAIGAPIGGWIGDRWGRRSAIIASVLFFGLASLPAAFTTNIWELAAARFIAGLGFGALLPNATAMIAEWMPGKVRGYAISMMIVGVPVGGFIGAALSSWLIATFGWQSTFIAGGLLAILLAGLLFAFLPESPHFAVRCSPRGQAVVPMLNRAFGANRYDETLEYVLGERSQAGWSQIFARVSRRTTLALAAAFFSSLMVFYGLANWLPTIITDLGMPLSFALKGAMAYNLAGLGGAIVVAALVTRLGSRRGLLVSIMGSLLAISALAYLLSEKISDPNVLLLVLSACGAFLAGLQVGLYTLAAAAFPTDCRSTGIGFAAGFGRFGPILSAVGGGMLLDTMAGISSLLGAALVSLSVTLISVMLVSRHTAPVVRP